MSIKVIGKMSTMGAIKPAMYVVKRRSTTDSFDTVIMKEFGTQSLGDCQNTCNMLNSDPDNRNEKQCKLASKTKKFYYLPSLVKG